MRKNLTTIVLMAVALLAVFFLTFHLHQTSKEQVLSQFNESQLLIAQQGARQIESYLRSRTQDLRWCSSLASLQDPDREKMAADIQSHFERLKMIHVNEISLLDEKGTFAYSTTVAIRGANHSQADFFSWAREPGNKGSVRIGYEKTDGRRRPMTVGSPALPRPGFSLVTPLYRESVGGTKQKPGAKFAGALMFTVDLEKMLVERSVLFTPAMKLHKLWIMDKDGTVLLQSEHPEMVMRNIRERDETCNQCHASFDHVETMLGKVEGATEYQIKGEKKKVAAFASMSFTNASWIVVVNAPLDEATAFVREDLKKTFLLLGLVVFVMGLAFYFAYRNYRRRVDGEMEVKRLRENQALMEELQETRDYLESLFNYANAPIIVWDPRFRITRLNHAFEHLIGYTAGEVIDRELQMLFPESNREESLSLIARTLRGEYWESVEIPILRKDGDIRTALWNSANILTTDGATLIATIAQGQDITERKQAEEKIQASLLEKETMLKEIHHRVKNNLQVISSLLNMQSSYLQDEKAREALWESMARIRTMAMIHTQLYQSQDLTKVDCDLFIQDLIGNISQSYGRAESPVEVKVDADGIRLGIDTLIPCGLILNELVTNALKHAFPEGKPGGTEGKINITIRSEDNRVVLTVQDNGIGFPESLDVTNLKSMGLKLVTILVRQMNGKINMRVDGGTTWTITFLEKKEREWQNGSD